MADAPIAPVFYREQFVLVKPSVKGLKTTGMDGQIVGDLFLADVYLTE